MRGPNQGYDPGADLLSRGPMSAPENSWFARRANHFVLSKAASFDVKPHLQKYLSFVFQKMMIVWARPDST